MYAMRVIIRIAFVLRSSQSVEHLIYVPPHSIRHNPFINLIGSIRGLSSIVYYYQYIVLANWGTPVICLPGGRMPVKYNRANRFYLQVP